MTYASHPHEHDPIGHAIRSALRAMSEGGRGRHRPGGHRHRPGGPRGDFAFGPGFPFGGPPFRHGRKARRGDVRAALLTLLDEEPRNGYGMMQEIERRSEGAWRPSPGAVYPALQQLEDEGFVRVVPAEGESGRRYELTDAGRAHVEENRDKLGAPWEAFTREVGDDMRATAMLIKDVALAAAQVLRAGDETQVEEARKVLTEARRALYLILAGSEEEASDDDD